MSYHVDKLQTQNWVKSDFEVKFDLKGHGRSSHKTIGILTKVFYICWSKYGDPSLNA